MKGRLVELPCAVGDKIYYIKEHCLIKNLGLIDWILGKEKENG